jgi:germacradienol/geosmin synthase
VACRRSRSWWRGEEAGNAVAVFRDFLDCDLGTAAEIVHDLYTARLRQFDHLVDVDLPEVVADLRIDPVTQDLLRRKIAGLRDWLAGDEHWILTSGRYFAPTPGETELLARAAAVAPIPEPELSSATPAGPGSPGSSTGDRTPRTRVGRGPSGLGTSAARRPGVRSPGAPPSS